MLQFCLASKWKEILHNESNKKFGSSGFVVSLRMELSSEDKSFRYTGCLDNFGGGSDENEGLGTITIVADVTRLEDRGEEESPEFELTELLKENIEARIISYAFENVSN